MNAAEARRKVRAVKRILAAPVLTCRREIPEMFFWNGPIRIECDAPMQAVLYDELGAKLVYRCKNCDRPTFISIREAVRMKSEWRYENGWWHKESSDENSS